MITIPPDISDNRKTNDRVSPGHEVLKSSLSLQKTAVTPLHSPRHINLHQSVQRSNGLSHNRYERKNPLLFRRTRKRPYDRFIVESSYAVGRAPFVKNDPRISAECTRAARIFSETWLLLGPTWLEGPTQTRGTVLPPTHRLDHNSDRRQERKKSTRGQISIPRPTDSREMLPLGPGVSPVQPQHPRRSLEYL